MKTRIIYTKFWYDNYVSSLSHKEKLAFLYFITNEKVNICGIYEMPDQYIKLDLKIKQNELDKIKDKFSKDGKFLFIDGWIKIMNFDLYNRFKGDLNEVAKEKEMALIPENVIGYQGSIDRVSENSDTLSNINISINHNINHNKYKKDDKAQKVFDYWNSKKIIIHKKLDEATRSKINTKLEDYPLEEIKDTIHNYWVILSGEEYYFKYRWTLKEFLQRGFEKFKDSEVADQNYRKDRK